MTDDERIVRQADDVAGVDPVRAEAPVTIGLEHDATAEADGLRVFVPRQLPRIAEVQPVVVLFDLAAAVDALLEHPEVVADTVADGRQLQRRERIHEAGREPAEASVAEAGIAFALQDLAELEPVVSRQLDRRFMEVHVHETEAEAAAGQELRRQIADPFDVAGEVRPLRREPSVYQAIAHRVRERVIEVERGRVPNFLGAGVDDVRDDGGAKIGVGEAGAPAGGALSRRRRVVGSRRSNGDRHAVRRPWRAHPRGFARV
jgi:hypothetical protein